MTIQTVEFNPNHIDSSEVTTRPFNSPCAISDLEYHPEVTEGPAITGLVHDSVQDTGKVRIGLWDRNGHSLIDANPQLIQERDVQEPELRECWVNIYRSTETPHGFTVGSKTGTEDDMKARGLRNQSGNYLTTVKIVVDLNAR